MSTDAKAAKNYYDTVVVGAGISGLACASKLLEHHHKTNSQASICVLEARDRIGGRIGAVVVDGNRLDIGANWIHGTGTADRPNPLMEILPHKRYREVSSRVAFQPPKEQEPSNNRTAVQANGNDDWEDIGNAAPTAAPSSSQDLVVPAAPTSTIMRNLWKTIGSLHEEAHTCSADEASNTTMLSALQRSKAFRAAFEELPPEYHPVLSGLPQFIEPMEAAPLVPQSAVGLEDAPGVSLAEYAIDDFDGDQVFLQDGYLAIVEEIARPLIAAGAIHTDVEVLEIDSSDSPISVKTTSGVYHAKTVVCTLPLGVLKQKALKPGSPSPLFNPVLPRGKLDAISSLGFGTLDKIFSVYSSPWWTVEPFKSILDKGFSKDNKDDDSEPDSFMGFTHELPGLSVSQNGEVSSGPRLLSIVNLHSMCGFPVLSAFLSCANATQVETLSNDDAGALVRRALTAWFGRKPPKPQKVHVTRWASDPHSLGSYSHMITGVSKKEHRGEFQTPVQSKSGGQLRFAGEHTSRNHFATVHGALLSGWREAEGIIEESRQSSA